MTIEVYSKKNSKIKITFPTKKNGSAVAKLIRCCPTLDLNSTYHYLIQSHYFNQTCSVAFQGEKVIAFVSGFINPANKNCLWSPGTRPENSAALPSSDAIILMVLISPEYLGAYPSTAFYTYNLTLAVSSGIVVASATIPDHEDIKILLPKYIASDSPGFFADFIFVY